MCSKVVHKKIASTIMSRGQAHVIGPIIELCIRRLQKALLKSTRWIAVKMLREHRHAFVVPTQIYGMLVPVNHVLKLVSQGTIIISTTGKRTIYIHIEH